MKDGPTNLFQSPLIGASVMTILALWAGRSMDLKFQSPLIGASVMTDTWTPEYGQKNVFQSMITILWIVIWQ